MIRDLVGMSLLGGGCWKVSCSFRGESPSLDLHIVAHPQPPKVMCNEFHCPSLVQGVQLPDSHGEIWQCWAWADCPRGFISFSVEYWHPSLPFALHNPHLVPSSFRPRWTNHLSQYSYRCVQVCLPLKPPVFMRRVITILHQGFSAWKICWI